MELQHGQYERLHRTLQMMKNLGAFARVESTPRILIIGALSLRDLWDALDGLMEEIRSGAGVEESNQELTAEGAIASTFTSSVTPLLMKLLPL
jgi:hypothetical protein